MAEDTELALRMPPETEAVPEMLDRIEAYAETVELGPRVTQRLALLCEELVTNVATHAQGASFVSLRIWRAGDAVWLAVEDDGPAFDPLAQAAPDTELGVEEREIGGLGIHFVRSLVRQLDYLRQDGVNRLTAVLDAA